MGIGLGSIVNTLSGLNPQTLAQAAEEEERKRLAAQAAQAIGTAQQAGNQYQQAAQSPAPDLGLAELFIPALIGNIASVIGQNPAYAEQGQERIQQSRATLLKSRADNLQSLRDIWMQKAEAAQKAGDIEAEQTARSKHESITRTYDLVSQNAAHASKKELESQEQENRIALERERGAQDRLTNQSKPAGAGPYGQFDAQSVAQGVLSGQFPPDPSGYSRGQWGLISGEIRKLDPKFNVSKAMLDWRGLRQFATSLNQGQQVRLRQNAFNAMTTADLIDELIGEIQSAAPPRTPVTALNRAQLNAIKNGLYGPGAAEAATRLEAQIAAWRLEMANVYSGGYAAQEAHLHEAARLIDPNWSLGRIRAGLEIGRRDTNIRLSAVNEAGAVTPSNPLLPGQGADAINIGPNALPGGATGLVRVDYDGKTYHFPSQEKANIFKQRMGIP